MNPWVVLTGVTGATAAVTAVFWLMVMPRLAAHALGRMAAALLLGGYAAVLIAIPAAGTLLLAERTAGWICGIIVGWAMAVRGAGWLIARSVFVPWLKATAQKQEAGKPTGPHSGSRPADRA